MKLSPELQYITYSRTRVHLSECAKWSSVPPPRPSWPRIPPILWTSLIFYKTTASCPLWCIVVFGDGPEKLRAKQHLEYGSYIDYVRDPKTAPAPNGDNKGTTKKYFLNEKVIFHDQMVVPIVFRDLILHMCHGVPASGGHLALKATCDKLRDRFWWPNMSKDVAAHIKRGLSC